MPDKEQMTDINDAQSGTGFSMLRQVVKLKALYSNEDALNNLKDLEAPAEFNGSQTDRYYQRGEGSDQETVILRTNEQDGVPVDMFYLSDEMMYSRTGDTFQEIIYSTEQDGEGVLSFFETTERDKTEMAARIGELTDEGFELVSTIEKARAVHLIRDKRVIPNSIEEQASGQEEREKDSGELVRINVDKIVRVDGKEPNLPENQREVLDIEVRFNRSDSSSADDVTYNEQKRHELQRQLNGFKDNFNIADTKIIEDSYLNMVKNGGVEIPSTKWRDQVEAEDKSNSSFLQQ